MTPIPFLRHLDYGSHADLADVGAAGVQAVLDGHDVNAWRPILAAVQRDPWGVVAERVERVLPHLETYGTAGAIAGWITRCRGGVTAAAGTLADIRRAHGLSQRELAARMTVSQAQVARLEAADNPTLGSLARYLAALDARPVALVAAADSGDATVVRLPLTATPAPRGRHGTDLSRDVATEPACHDDDVRRVVEQWVAAAPALEAARRNELRSLTDREALESTLDLLGMLDRLPRLAPRPSSGLVEQQRIFAAARRS